LPELQSSVRTLASDFPLEAAAINGLSQLHGSHHRDRRDENLGPQLARSSPAALYGSLPALSPSKGPDP
jgi:hypothetical protein